MDALYASLLVLALWFCPTEQKSCHTSEWDLCTIPSLLHARETIMAKNGSALTSSCKVWSSSWKCVDNYIANCLTDIHSMAAEIVLKQSRKNFQEFCDPSSKLRTEYEKNLPCISDALALTFQNCMDNLENVIYMIAGDNADDRVNAACCYFERGYQCLKRNTIKLCGKGSFDTLKEAVNFFHFDTANSICFSHNPEDEICTDYLTREVPAPSESASYLARLAVRFLRYLQ